jgi:dihydrofolate reductase/thymidylate synthase
MCANFILAVDKHLGIAKDGVLPWNIKEDMKYFKEMTMGDLLIKDRPSRERGLLIKDCAPREEHVVVMGYNTWLSMKKKILPGRFNVVISANITDTLYGDGYVLCNYGVAYSIVDKYIGDGRQVFIIGGDKTFNNFLDRIKKVYLTHIDKEFKCDTFATFFENMRDEFKLVDYSEEHYSESEDCKFRFLTYETTDQKHNEYQYLNLLKDIMANGTSRDDRTGTGTIGVFGRQLRFNISEHLPLLTTKFVSYKSIVKELLWFLRGETDSKTLEKDGVKIWKGNSSKEFIDKCGLDYREGDIGPMYGFQWRHFGTEYKGCDADYSNQGVNQLDEVIKLLKEDPYSRRIMMTTYNVNDRHKGVLYPCHGIIVQFFVDDIEGKKHLSCHMYQRSMDSLLGAPYNIASYATLTYMIAMKVDMAPHELVISTGDTHIYKNHIEQCKTQLKRRPYPAPKLEINPEIKTKEWKDITVDDFKLIGYLFHPAIKAEMSI